MLYIYMQVFYNGYRFTEEIKMDEKEFLKNYDITKYDRPSIAADIVLFTLGNSVSNAKKVNIGPLQILLIKRASHPYKDNWALPGGFFKEGETIEETAVRELYEETNVSNAYLENIKTFSENRRDPRGWIVSNAFIGAINKSDCNLRADSDAWEAKWFDISLKKDNSDTYNTKYNLTLVSEDDMDKLNATIECNKSIEKGRVKRQWNILSSDNLAFDHSLIITELLYKLKDSINNDIRLLFEFVPELFTIGQLEGAYKSIYGLENSVPNFRRSIEKYVIETDMWAEKTSYRPAKLYKKNYEKFL